MGGEQETPGANCKGEIDPERLPHRRKRLREATAVENKTQGVPRIEEIYNCYGEIISQFDLIRSRLPEPTAAELRDASTSAREMVQQYWSGIVSVPRQLQYERSCMEDVQQC